MIWIPILLSCYLECDETQGNNSAQALLTKIVLFGCEKIEKKEERERKKKKEKKKKKRKKEGSKEEDRQEGADVKKSILRMNKIIKKSSPSAPCLSSVFLLPSSFSLFVYLLTPEADTFLSKALVPLLFLCVSSHWGVHFPRCVLFRQPHYCFFVFRRIGDYAFLDLFYFVNLTIVSLCFVALGSTLP